MSLIAELTVSNLKIEELIRVLGSVLSRSRNDETGHIDECICNNRHSLRR